MRVSAIVVLIGLAGGALAGCAGASGCCCYDFDSAGNKVLLVKPGTSQAEIDAFEATS